MYLHANTVTFMHHTIPFSLISHPLYALVDTTHLCKTTCLSCIHRESYLSFTTCQHTSLSLSKHLIPQSLAYSTLYL
uniref:Uncharacterized protein n=1 Tax=Octopus bimaculoides TaxID=37653 RepID=A0A0L8GA16_OCTBM